MSPRPSIDHIRRPQILAAAAEVIAERGVAGTRIADDLLSYDLVKMVSVTIHKPQAPIPVPFSDVSVTIRRTRPDEAAHSAVAP